MQLRKRGLILLFLLFSVQFYGQLPGYYFYKTLTIQSSQVQGPGNHLDFPVLIKHTDFDLRYSASGGDVQNINGWDIRFTAADGVTILPHQLESYVSTTGEIVAWVKVPVVSSTVNTDIRMYYGNSSISTDPSLTSTWNSKYKGVWHLHNDILDGTSNSHNMTNVGSTNKSACIAADGQNFVAGQSLTRPLDATLQFSGDLTLEGWVRLTTLQAATYENVIFSCGATAETAVDNYKYFLSIDGTKNLRTYWESGTGFDNVFTSSAASTIVVNTWMHVAVVRNVTANTLLFYTDGNQLGASVAFTNDPSGGTNSVFRIGQDASTTTRDLIGDLDELRISDTLRSGAWIKTNYNTMFSPSTFYTIGPEYNACAIAPTTANAGPDQAICATTTATLAGNFPVYGTGAWTVIAGTGTVTTPTSPTSGVSGLSVGANTFRWTISNGAPCTPSTDDVTITNDVVPTTSVAGPDQVLCVTAVATLAANTPVIGTGAWTVTAGSGTVTTPASPTSGVTALSVGVNTFRWTISNGSCTVSTDDISITRYAAPTISAAGPDQTLCTTTATLAGNTPATGTGAWTVITGSATVTTPASPTSGVTGLSVGVNTFRWTISNGTCTSSTDDITITRQDFPTVAAAGTDQTLCTATATLAGNAPTVGTGAWTVIAGSGAVTTSTSPTSGVTGLSVGVNTFRWTISNGTCTSTSDDVTINRDASPTVAAAGPDQAVCATTGTLAGNTPVTGSRVWTVIAGSATVTNPTLPTSAVTGLSVGINTFRWTISNGTCPASTDDITITRTNFPTTSAAGPDQNVCATTATMAGNAATVGTGAWTLVSGAGTVTTPASPTSGVTALGVGANTFRWTISNGICPTSTDDVIITRTAAPTTANAGPDQSRCVTTATLAGNTPTVGTGAWTLVSGAGTVTTPTSPTSGITGLGIGANTFRWTISNGICTASTDNVIITLYANPTVSAAGPDQTVCATTATLAGNTPTVGTGTWTLISGAGTITTPTSPTSGVTGLGVGANTFRWTISNGACTASTDNIIINRTNFPTTSAAGLDQSVCATTATMAGNTATVGTGAWTLISGAGSVTTPASPTSGVTALGIGANTFRWTISNGICPPSTDDIIITRYVNPTVSAAGPDQTICDTMATLAGNTPAIGSGIWTVIAGTGTVTTPSFPTSAVTGLSPGVNTFRWTISNGACTASSDNITITRYEIPTVPDAGLDQTVCATTDTLAGNTPIVGTGAWTVITGSAIVTTPSSPTSGVTALSVGVNTFRWTISNGVCPSTADDITINRDNFPTVSNAGTDQTICDSVSTLAGNTATVGTGVWTVITGTAIVTSPSSPTSAVTGLGIGVNTFRWTISNGSCAPSDDDITINRDEVPTVADAGIDQTVCDTVATLLGNTPIVGTGVWTVIAGTAIITSPSSPTSGVTALSVGVNTFRWTISNGTCASSNDDITINREDFPTISNAGTDQTICDSVSTLAGNTATVGTGVWTVITGTAIVTSPSSPTSAVTGLGIGVNTFRWTISNGSCAPSDDDITINRDEVPTVADAGIDQTVCDTVTTLLGNTPIVGTGVWTVITGTAIITSPSSPTSGVTALSVGVNTFRWTISNGTCASSNDDITINREDFPTVSNAGTDQTVCATTDTLAGNTPIVGTGLWTVITGTAIVTSPSSPTSAVTGLSVGVNTFRWTISNGSCTPSVDDVTITRTNFPTISAAGPDQTVCATTATLAGNTPSVGTGAWTIITGSATVTTPSSPSSAVTGLSVGVNTFRWTIANGSCTPSTDDITITRTDFPTTSAAGPDQTVCATTATLAGNTPTVGTGAWTVITGSATVTTPSSPTSGVTGLSFGANTFRWTISNGICTSSIDNIVITRNAIPTASAAGPDQSVCATTATLAGNIPIIGTGAWTVIAGAATVTTPSSSSSGVTGLSVGVNTFRWTITNGACPASIDDVSITRTDFPTTSVAGGDQSVCVTTTTTLAGNTPSVGTGAWTVITGSATVTTPSSPTSGVTGLGVGVNTFRWTISNGICVPSTDDITVVRTDFPTTSNAGIDQTVCSTTATLAANTPTVGAGAWTVIAGTATVTTLSSPTSGVTGLSVGVNTFRWTITNGTCPPSTDDITITRTDFPTTAAAGSDQSVCVTTATLSGNTPTLGTGAWTVIAGAATVTTPSSPTSGVTGLSVGTNTFRWTISNGICVPSTDDITIIRTDFPTTSNAGTDQTVCSTTSALAGNIPSVGSGAWTMIAGAATITSPTSPTSGVTGLSVGVNTFRWTITNGTCPASIDDITITRTNFPTTAAAGTDQSVCDTITALAGNIPIVGTGIWTVISGTAIVTTPSSASSGVTGLSVGVNTFRWTISNGSCAPSSDDIIVTRYTSPSVSIAGTDQTICATTASLAGNTPAVGTGAWTVIAGSATVTTPASPTSGVTGLSIGINTFRWTISNGACSPSTDDITITRTSPPTTSAAGPNQSVCDTMATLAGNTPIVGTGIWTVLSGTGVVTTPTSPTSTVTGLSFGINVFRWIISNGSCTPSSDNIAITRYATPTASIAGTDQIVCNTTASLAGNTPAIGTGSWTVITGSATVTTPSSPTSGVTGLSVGTNTFRWTISNGACTPSSDDVTITREDYPTTAAAGSDQTLCDSTATLAGNTPIVGTGIWTLLSGTGAITTPSSPTSAVTGMSVGTNTFRWTITNGTCPASSDIVTITINPLPSVANAGTDQTVCATTATLAGNTPTVGTGNWTVVSGGASITTSASPASGVTGMSVGANVFVWTIISGTCPVSTDTIIVSVNTPTTMPDAGFDSTICSSSSSLNGNIPTVGTGLWTVVSGTGSLTSPTSFNSGITGMSVGVNTFAWTISNGACPSLSDTVMFTIDSFPSVADAGFDFTACSPTASLNANVPTIGTGSWTVVSGGASLTTPSSPTSAVTGMSVGANLFVWTVTNGTCPVSTDTVIVSVNPPTTMADAGFDSTICSSSSSLNGNIPTVGTGLWTVVSGTGSLTSPTAFNSGITGMSVGVNTFAWTISNGACPSFADTVTINIDPFSSVADAGFDSVICSTSSSLNATPPAVGTGVWTVVSGGGTLTSPSSAISGVTGMSVGANTFVWATTNGACPSSFDTVIVTVDPLTTIANAGSDSSTCSSSYTLNGNIPTVGTGTWTLISGSGTISSPSSAATTVSGLSLGSNIFRWTITSGSCPQTTDDVEIIVDTNPTIASAGIDIYTSLSAINLNANTPLTGVGSWSLMSGAGMFSNTSDPATLVSSLNVGSNIFRWTISNGACPASTDDVMIFVTNLNVPNGFSPNADNVNDYFVIPGLSEYSAVELTVFNRWGNSVYSNSDYKNDWDGNNNSGAALSDDTYYYTLKLNEEETIKGYIVIKRK